MTMTIDRKYYASGHRRGHRGNRPTSTMTRRSLGLIVLAVAARVSSADAATITASSCNATAVQAALGSAVAGDTVRIPAGTCAWTSTIAWSAPANVSVIGAGDLSTLGGGDATIIVDNVASGVPLMTINVNSSGTFRLAGITIRGGTGLIKEEGMIKFGGTSAQVRVDHVHIDKRTYSPQNNGKFMVVGGMLRGVIDHSLFSAGSTIGWIHFVNGQDGASGDASWAQNTGFGTADFMYVEDSRIEATRSGSGPPMATFSDCHTGGKFVIRYSQAFNSNVGQTHPTGHGSDDRGCRAFELYGITATSDGNFASQEPNFSFSYNNSGPELVWGNSVNNVYKNIIYFNDCRLGTACGYSPPYGGWGVCGQGSPWDQNSDGSGYACIDQPGRGKGDLIKGTFPNKVNSAFGTASWPRQQLEPIYEWLTSGSTVSGWGGSWLSNGAPSQVQQNRDFFLEHGNAGCNPGAATCSTGVGVGTLAQRPANCALNTAWWATDQGGDWNKVNATSNDGALYRCVSTNSWALYYTPYTYPHPLTMDGDNTIPKAPGGIVIN